ncbi:hypothetical protein L1987_06589 [Smallanthus sonchifolius]|uniref:Uncharacterized protein n=1 Tax=Smallanthus sonchifolius TaxID=185202 RepID=A0ACB9JYR6_9ASTR|nr:hypothetical protein L1987_06589 [Smallanthus sonchifolius]
MTMTMTAWETRGGDREFISTVFAGGLMAVKLRKRKRASRKRVSIKGFCVSVNGVMLQVTVTEPSIEALIRRFADRRRRCSMTTTTMLNSRFAGSHRANFSPDFICVDAKTFAIVHQLFVSSALPSFFNVTILKHNAWMISKKIHKFLIFAIHMSHCIQV